MVHFIAPADVACSSRLQGASVSFSFSLFLILHLFLLFGPLCPLKLQAEVSTMKRSRSVADIESSSNGEVAVLEELEDVMFQVCSPEEGLLFWHVQLVHLTFASNSVWLVEIAYMVLMCW